MMRIAIVGQTYYPSANGQAVFTTQLAEGLATNHHEVVVIAPSNRPRTTVVRHNNVVVHRVRAIALMPRYPDVRLTLFDGDIVRCILTDFQPDLVHVQDHYALSRSALRVAKENHWLTLGTNHFMPENILMNLPFFLRRSALAKKLLWHSMLSVFNRLDVATAPTHTAVRILQGQDIRVPLLPISCGIDLTRFHPDPHVRREDLFARYGLDPARTIVLFVGRIDREKRIDLLLDAMHLLQRDDVQLAIAGKGSHLPALRAQAKALNVEDSVRFLGFVPEDDLPRLLNSVDLFVMPSEAELQSIATLEAMATANPILVARAQALPELVEPGVNGYLFTPGNSEEMAQQLQRLLAEKTRWRAMGAASWQKVQQHSLANSMASYEKLYQLLITACSVPAQPHADAAGWGAPAPANGRPA